MSNTYLQWAKDNLALNSTTGRHEFIQADCVEWLEKEAKNAARQYDLIFLDPPTFSNSKKWMMFLMFSEITFNLLKIQQNCLQKTVYYIFQPTLGSLNLMRVFLKV